MDAVQKLLWNFSRHSPSITPTPTSTPPPHSESEYIEEARSHKEQARRALVEDGCPTCYPTGLESPLQKIPDEYRRIVSYWESLSATGDVVLCAQLSDWREFRGYQERVRRHYLRTKSLTVFQDKARDRRRRYGLKGDVSLTSDPGEQSDLENWIEFQNYHLEIDEGLAKKIKDDREKLDAERKKLETGAPALEGIEELETFEWRVKVGESKLRQHNNLLQWIEQQRIALVAVQATSIQDTRGPDRPRKILAPLAPGRRNKRRNNLSILNKVRSAVSKNPPRKRRSLRPPERNVAKPAENVAVESSAPRRSKRILDLGASKHRLNIESTPLRPFRPQRVSKIAKIARKGKSSTNVIARPRPTDRLPRRTKQNSADWTRRNRSASMVTTRSGRKSSIPKRFCPS